MAAGIGDAFGVADGGALGAFAQLWQSVHPGGVGAVSGAGVDEAHGGAIGREGDGFLGGGVGQAEEDEVGAADHGAAGGRVFALRGVDGDDFEVVATGEAFVDFEAGGAFATVDKDAWFRHGWI